MMKKDVLQINPDGTQEIITQTLPDDWDNFPTAPPERDDENLKNRVEDLESLINTMLGTDDKASKTDRAAMVGTVLLQADMIAEAEIKEIIDKKG